MKTIGLEEDRKKGIRSDGKRCRFNALKIITKQEKELYDGETI